MDLSSTYLLRGLSDGQMKKILAVGKEISMKKGSRSSRKARRRTGSA